MKFTNEKNEQGETLQEASENEERSEEMRSAKSKLRPDPHQPLHDGPRGLHHRPPHHHHPPHHHPPHVFPGLNSPFTEALGEFSGLQSTEELLQLISEHQPSLVPILNQEIAEGVRDPSLLVELLQIGEGVERLRHLRELILLSSQQKLAVILPLPPHISDRFVRLLNPSLVLTSEYHLPPHLNYQHYDHTEAIMPGDLLQRLDGIEGLAFEGFFEAGEIQVRSNVLRLLYLISRNNQQLKLFLHSLPHLPRHAEFGRLDHRYQISLI